MNNFKAVRVKKGLSVAELARRMPCSRSYLHKIESGEMNPSNEFLIRLSEVLGLTSGEAGTIGVNIGPADSSSDQVNQSEKVDRLINVLPGQNTKSDQGVSIRVPDALNVLYSDIISLTSSEYGMVFDFGQKLGPTNQFNVVARIGMSAKHAKALLNLLQGKLKDKNE